MKKLIDRIKQSPKAWNLIGRIFGREMFKGKLKNRDQRVTRLIFVCTGNICRSPYAHYKAKQLFPDLEIASAGISAESNEPANPMAISVSEKFGVDLTPHRTTRFSEYQIMPTDLILIMDSYHKAYLQRSRPDLLDRVVLLGSFCKSKEFPLMVGDPWRLGERTFSLCYSQIDDALSGLKSYLEEAHR